MSQLRVGSIATTAGTSVLSLNNGILTDPNKPAFHAYPTANQNAAGIGTFTATSTNVGNCFSTSTYRFTAPVAGNYFFTCTSLPSTSVSTVFFRFRKNGADLGPLTYMVNNDELITASMIATMSVNDTMDVYFYANGFEYLFTSFSGFLVG